MKTGLLMVEHSLELCRLQALSVVKVRLLLLASQPRSAKNDLLRRSMPSEETWQVW